MNHDDYLALRRGKLQHYRGLQSILTGVGAGLYSYMVMLGLAGRTYEEEFYKDIRNRVFEVRDQIQHDSTQETFDRLSEDMRAIYSELNTAYTFLKAHKPEEATILQSVTNTANGLIHDIRTFLTPTT